MKKRILLSFILLVLIYTSYNKVKAQVNNENILIGNQANDVGVSLAITPNNNILILGSYQFSKFSLRQYLYAKLFIDGEQFWTKTYGNDYQIEAAKIISLEDNRYAVLGSVKTNNNYDLNLIIIDSNGEIISNHFYNYKGIDKAFDIIETKNNEFIIVGITECNGPRSEVLAVRIDNNFNIKWEKYYGGKLYDHAFSIVEDENENLIIVGSCGGFYSRAGWEYKNHDSQFLLYKIDKDGNIINEKIWGNTGHDSFKKIIKSNANSYYAIGSSQRNDTSSFDIVLTKFNSNLNIEWTKYYGSEEWEYGESLTLSQDNFLYLIGTTANTDNQKPDQLILKTNLAGEIEWSQQLGYNGSDYGKDIMCLNDTTIIATGCISDEENNQQISLYKISNNGDVIINSLNPTSLGKSFIVANPHLNTLKINVDTAYTAPFIFSIYNTSGKKIASYNLKNSVSTIRCSDLAHNVYLYYIRNNHTVISTGKFIY